jgi:hypothetical protein
MTSRTEQPCPPVAAGQVIEQRQTHWIQVRDGKLVEHHAVRDDLRLLVRLGIIPISAGLTADDTVGVPSCNLFDAAVQGAHPEVSGAAHRQLLTSRTPTRHLHDRATPHSDSNLGLPNCPT